MYFKVAAPLPAAMGAVARAAGGARASSGQPPLHQSKVRGGGRHTLVMIYDARCCGSIQISCVLN